MDAYEQRLRKRHTEDEPAIQRRLAAAQSELARAGEYRYQVVNDELGVAVGRLKEIVQSHW